MFDASNQVAYNGAGAKFDADSAASLSANENSQSFLQQINPGNQITVKVVSDVPKGTQLAKLELHDSAFSGGVDVTL